MATIVEEQAADAAGTQSPEGRAAPAPAAPPPPDPAPPDPAPPRGGWRYAAADGRDLRLDLLRGFAVFAMVVDHIGGASWLYALTGGNRFFVSAAEGFVFLSGVTVGLVYGTRARRDGFRAAATKLLNRSWTLYALAVWLALATAFAAALFDLPRGALLSRDPARFVIEVVTLQRTFYLVDVMLFYALAMLAAPLALWALLRRRWWVVGLASWALWAAYQFAPDALVFPWRIADNPVFNFLPWQVLFFTGMILGYGRDWLRRWLVERWPRLPVRDGGLILLGVLLAGLIYLHATNAAILAPVLPWGDPAAWLDRWFDKSALPFPRLLACALVFAFLWGLVSRCWTPIRRATGWLLLPLGQGALYAYAAHLFVIIGLQLALRQFWGQGDGNYPDLHPAADALIQIGGVLVVWGLTRLRLLQGLAAPLGGPPLATLALPRWRRVVPRPSDSLAAIGLVALLCLPFLYGGGIGGGTLLRAGGGATGSVGAPAGGGGEPGGSQPSSPRGGASPASTVTVPRSVAGSARGSSGYTGRNDQPGASPAPARQVPSSGGGPSAQPAASADPSPEPGAASSAAQPSGGYLKDGAFYSDALGRIMPYGIYLPPTYDSDPTRRYPVVYMLHGAGGHYSEWVAYGLPEAAEDLLWDGQIQPMIIVMPQGDHSYFVNHVGTDGERWGDYIAFDLVAHIDTTYRTIPQPSSRALGGLSMGGFGALQIAFSHPEIFGTVGGHSPALHSMDQLDDIINPADAEDDYDPVTLAARIDPLYAPHIWVDAGSDDEWAARVVELGRVLDGRGISHEVQLLPGRHSADYWTDHAGDYIRFYSRSLIGGQPGAGATP